MLIPAAVSLKCMNFTNENSWFMKFLKNCEKDEKMRCNERNGISQTVDLMKINSLCGS